MRLSIQRCLILLLCCYSSSAFSGTGHPNDPFDNDAIALAACEAQIAQESSPHNYRCENQPSQFRYAYRQINTNLIKSYLYYKESVPECAAPNFIDSVTGECVPPKEICFTTIENMENECVYIGTDDPTAPEGCVVDSVTGFQICLSDQPGCYVADGKTICPTPDMVCGVKNGTFSCVAPEQEGCGYFNGERVCFAPDGQKVDNTSPDHPDNGGNLDGDDTNDPKDPRPVDQGGDSENQVDNGKGNATEKTALNQLNEQKNINKNLKSIDNSIKNLSSSLTQDVGSGELSSIENSVKNPLEPGSDLSVAFDSHIDAIDTNKSDVGLDMVQGIGTKVTGLVSQGSCSELSYTSALTSFSLGCEKTKKIRDLLSWVLYLLTVWVCFNVITEPTTRRG